MARSQKTCTGNTILSSTSQTRTHKGVVVFAGGYVGDNILDVAIIIVMFNDNENSLFVAEIIETENEELVSII